MRERITILDSNQNGHRSITASKRHTLHANPSMQTRERAGRDACRARHVTISRYEIKDSDDRRTYRHLGGPSCRVYELIMGSSVVNGGARSLLANQHSDETPGVVLLYGRSSETVQGHWLNDRLYPVRGPKACSRRHLNHEMKYRELRRVDSLPTSAPYRLYYSWQPRSLRLPSPPPLENRSNPKRRHRAEPKATIKRFPGLPDPRERDN